MRLQLTTEPWNARAACLDHDCKVATACTRRLPRADVGHSPLADDGPAKEFTLAMDQYKRASGRMFPTWSEVLEVLNGLGYYKPIQ